MKPLIIIATIFILQAGVIYAGNDRSPALMTKENVIMNIAPAAPAGVVSEELPAESAPILELAPIIPSEATFDELPLEKESIKDLAPIIPKEADFQDTVDPIKPDVISITPTTPAEADFE